MTQPVNCVLLAIAALFFASCRVQVEAAGQEEAADPLMQARTAEGLVVRLSYLDDLRSTYCFRTPGYGLIIEGGQIYNKCSQLTLRNTVDASLVVGIEGGSRGAIRDIGDVRTLRTTKSVLPFLSLREGRVVDESEEGSSIPQDGILLDEEPRSDAAAPVRPGHLYVIKLVEERGAVRSELHVVVRVLEHRPGESVTFRWRML